MTLNSSVDDLCRSYLDLKYHFDPAAASAAGLVSEDSRLGRFDVDSTREHLSALRSVMGAIEELDADDLQREIDRTALLGEIRSTIYRLEFEQPNRRNPAFWLLHLFQALYSLLTRDEDDAAGRVTAVVARLRSVPEFVDAARATIDQPAAIFVDTALGMLGGGGELIAQVVRVFGGATPDLAGELEKAGEEALKALVAFGAALRDEIEPSEDPQAFAIGEEQFSRRLQHEHALNAGPGELWRYGMRLQEDVTGQLAAQAEQLGATSWRDLVDRLRDDSPTPEELLATYRAEVERARRFVTERNLVGLPESQVEVVTTPSHLAPMVPFAAYEPPPVYLKGRSGRFYVTKPNPALPPEIVAQQRRGHCRHAIPAMVAHEVYPGHHLHLATMQALGSEVRRHIWSPVMVEGWAVYCEQLMAEAGYYQTSEARLFQLVNLLWRAIRIVLDIGLHTRGMTPAEAAEYMVQHLPIERTNAEAEIRRYCAWPTYQLCYAVGRRELLRLRHDYHQHHVDPSDLRQFHDELTGYGGIPVSLARWGLDLVE
ncbi:MAG TPA: DUF885 domain-containing protein [Gemmatimonadales bacterium]|nr:DUF885 domain-containing protein [Gemmatimonadales bacterium]